MEKMGTWRWVILVTIGASVSLLTGLLVDVPGYMDADYYFSTSKQLASGDGLLEPFIWNYLSPPETVVHPSHLYWLPLTSFVAAIPQILFRVSFAYAQIPFILITALLPVLAAGLTIRLTGDAKQAWYAGWLAAFPGFFLPFLVTTDAFSLYLLLGWGVLWLMAEGKQKLSTWQSLLVGILVGLGHLARADGVLWLLVLVPYLIAASPREWEKGLVLISGYLLVMTPWWVRNLQVSGALMGAGGLRSLWLLSYDDLYSYPADHLTFSRWLGNGLLPLLVDRLHSAGVNLQRAVGEVGMVFLWPFMLLGGWQLRDRSVVRIAAVFLILLFLIMSFIFPYIGSHGAFFHSSIAVLPLTWALAPVGLDKAIEWGANMRGWNQGQAKGVLKTAAVTLIAGVTLGLLLIRTTGVAYGTSPWSASHRSYRLVERELDSLGMGQSQLFAVNNPPGFYNATGFRSVVIPNGDPSTLKQVVDRYGVDWVILEFNHPTGLDGLYKTPMGPDWITRVVTVEDEYGRAIHLLEVQNSGPSDE